jgi:N-acetylmuramic acid 6-phosphate etherase
VSRATGNSSSVEEAPSPTEARNPRTVDIDRLPTQGILELLNDEDATVPAAVRAALPALAVVVDAAVGCFEAGGAIHYFGAGTSGRLALLDAAEVPPTFSVDPSRVIAHHAGGDAAASRALESAEDDEDLGRAAAAGLGARDMAIGLAASGHTPFVLGAIRAARDAGAFTALVSSNPVGPIAAICDVHVFVDTGPEAIAGSTRLKAGTAQKLVLNSLSTALMVRLGRTYSNLMIDVSPKNAKLRGRVLRILEQATGASREESAAALREAEGDVRTALVSLAAAVDAEQARAALDASGGHVRTAVDALGKSVGSPDAARPRGGALM